MKTLGDVFSFQLFDGIGLIEANAGTGKTFSIEVIFLKAILELELQVHQILLITFMRNVTVQMKSRVFETLQTSYNYFNKTIPATPFQPLLNTHKKNSEKAKELLHRALINFDENNIVSIHSFATQVNNEFFLDSNLGKLSNLDNNLKNSTIEEITHSFWIKNILPETANSHFFLQVFELEKKNYKIFFDKLAGKKEFVHFFFSEKNSQQIPLTEYFQKGKESFSPEVILDLYEKTKHLQRKQIKSLKNKALAIQQAFVNNRILYKNTDNIYFQKWNEELKQVGAENLCRKNSAMQSLLAYLHAEKKFVEYYRSSFLSFANQKLQTYKKEKQVYEYDDIIYSFYKISKKRKITKFSLVLVDEFQDTDWTQSRAFLNFFPKKTKMILVGDPKQAIFSFRGGDVFSYLKMKEDFVNSKTYQLDTNWRSQKEIVENVNLLFEQTNSLEFDKIKYFPSKSMLEPSKGIFENGTRHNVWNIWEFKPEEKKIYEGKVQKQILKHLNYQITNIINSGIQGALTIEGRPVEPEMICILVQTNDQAKEVKNSLTKIGIFAITTLKDSITTTRQFQDWWNFLQSLPHYQNKKMLTSVLISSLFKYNLQQVVNFNDEQWGKVFQNFKYFYQTWERKGIMTMSQKVVKKMKIVENLLTKGSRAVSNFFQSLDWFAMHLKKQDSLERNIVFLTQKINKKEHMDDLHLESDKNTVKIMTIHKSKGLEFPIVFCPYLWEEKKYNKVLKNTTNFFHLDNLQDNEKILCCDLSVDNIYWKHIITERKAENRRLLYVALTRAKQQVHIYTYPDAKLSDFQTLFNSLLQTKKEQLNSICRIQSFSESPNIDLLTTKQTKINKLEKRQRQFFLQKKDYSFSSLRNISYSKNSEQKSLKNTQYPQESFNSPQNFTTKPDKQKSLVENIRKLVSGAEIGSLFHKILEFWIAEKKASTELTEFINKNISCFAIDNSWANIFQQSCQNIIYHPLNTTTDSFCIANLQKHNIAKEMEFQFLLSKKELIEKISQLHYKYPQNYIISQNYHFLKKNQITDHYLQNICIGFIDLVFFWGGKYYILDWKSNNLGEIENYHPEKIKQIMKKYNYFLQYFLYYLALDRFLKIKKITDPIGGVFYIFLRGLEKRTPKNGVFFDAMDYM